MGRSLVIGVAASAAERTELARLLGGGDAILIVSTAQQARAFLDLTRAPQQRPQPVRREPVGLHLDPDGRVLRWQDREVALTRLEHDFLHCLAAEPGRVWTHQRLHQEVWGNQHLGRGSDIHSVVKRLRRKLVQLGASVTIHAIRGVGFRLLAPETAEAA